MNKNLKAYIILWATQAFSALGSGMTSYALVLWLYASSGSALKTAMLTVCSYSPYVLMSIFAGALSDRWDKKKTMLVCDLIAALSTLWVLFMIKSGSLLPWHLYLINAVSGLMNTVQQPASEVAATLLVPKEYYQKTSGLRSFSQSLNTILTPVFATTVFAFLGIEWVIAIDLATFLIAFLTLWLFIDIPKAGQGGKEKEPVLRSAKEGLLWLKGHRLIFDLIFFLAAINFVASTYEAALPAMVLSKSVGGEKALGAVNICVGLATLVGSVVAAWLPAPRDRVRAIYVALLISMSAENFLLAFTESPVIWCIGAVLGWLPIPFMNANMDVIFRNEIPPEIQGRVFSCRNTLQFFTIPMGYLFGGLAVDIFFEPFMAAHGTGVFASFFGSEKGAGAAMLFAVAGVAGVAVCLFFGRLLKKYSWSEKQDGKQG